MQDRKYPTLHCLLLTSGVHGGSYSNAPGALGFSHQVDAASDAIFRVETRRVDEWVDIQKQKKKKFWSEEYLLGYNAVYSVENQSTFRRALLAVCFYAGFLLDLFF
jgi:hypothetical protein